MIDQLVRGTFQNVKIYHLRMAFSEEAHQIGKFQFRKIGQLLRIIGKALYMRFRYRITALYYPPAGPDLVPMYRDMAILLAIRWAFPRTIFHFHAGGLSTLEPSLPTTLRFLFRMSYFNPDCSIRLSELNPPDGQVLHSKRDVVVPYGIEDLYGPWRAKRGKTQDRDVTQLLYVGVLRESKGILVLLDACRMLRDKGVPFRLTLAGPFESPAFHSEFDRTLDLFGLSESVRFLGQIEGERKWQEFADADIFCFPTYFECETFGLAVLEAMQFTLPVVATRWRGLPSLVREGESGFLVPVKDSKALAEKISLLIENPVLASRFGQKGRQIYLENFTLDRFLSEMERTFLSVLERPDSEAAGSHRLTALGR